MASNLQQFRNERMRSAARHIGWARHYRREARRLARRGSVDGVLRMLGAFEQAMKDWRTEVEEVLWADRALARLAAREVWS